MMDVSFDGFDWDYGNAGKCLAHGVSIKEIESTLVRKAFVIISDTKHSKDEGRYIAVGRTLNGRDLFLVLTFRTVADRKLIRPISARYMHRKEAERYEQTRTPV
jgi:uncharacterized DUF497 family protein